MEMEAFLAQSPDAAKVRRHINAAVLALSMAQQCILQPGLATATTADLCRYLDTALYGLEAARALVPAG
jgi:hypothetical protein